jgi:hypothetical protein
MNMPKCPFCSEELRIKLAAGFVSEFDDDFFSMLDAFAGRMSRLARGAIRSQFGRLKENPPLVNMIVCSSCDSVISAEMQKTG